MENKFLKEFNQENSILVISSYPRKKERYSKGVCAVASFTKNTLLAIKKQNPDKKIVILTMQLNNKTEIYKEDEMLIVRCFKRNNPLSYLNLLNFARKFNNVKTVMLEFEFSSFGDVISTGSLSFVVWALFILGKKINIIIHQVLLDLREISSHIGLSRRSLKIKAFNFALKRFYKFLSFPAQNVIVLEDELKNRLQNIISGDKITVIPHGVDRQVNYTLTKASARKKLGIKSNDFVVLYFGYLTWYKGVDFLIKSFQKLNQIKEKQVKLIVAGGPSFTQGEKEHYKKFLAKTEGLAKGYPHIQITGFVAEDQIANYFKAADLSVLPYRRFMSSSGPFSLALSFEKPVLLSSNLGLLIESKDAKEALDKVGLSKESLTFKLNSKDLLTKIISAQKASQHKKLLAFSKVLGEKRAFDNLAPIYLKTILQNYVRIYNRKLLVSPSVTR